MKKTSLNSVNGLYSSKKNPMGAPKKVSSEFSSKNPDAVKANKLMKQAYMEKESLRGKSGL